MSQGVLLYAHNTEKIDYLRIAQYNAQQIKRHLGLPVAVVTDRHARVAKGVFDEVVRVTPPTDIDTRWRNAERTDFNHHTPFSRTLVLDADYLVFSDWLKVLLQTDDALILSNCVRHVSGAPIADARLSDFGLDLVWATCFVFERDSAQALEFFALCDYVRRHYVYFGDLYDYNPALFRNDFVFSVAHHLARGQDRASQLVALNPRAITMTNRTDPVLEVFDDGLLVAHRASETGFTRVQNHDVHVLAKQSLLHALSQRPEKETVC